MDYVYDVESRRTYSAVDPEIIGRDMSTLLAEPKLIDGRFQEMKNRGWHDFSDRAPAEHENSLTMRATFFLAQPCCPWSINECLFRAT